MSTTNNIGKPVSRLDGIAKVTGEAQYAGEYNSPDLLYGYVVNSTITKGKILDMNTDFVKAIPGVLEIFTHENCPSLAWFDFQYADMDAPPGTVFKPLSSAEIKFNGQPIALVVADSFELSRYAASQLVVKYAEESFVTRLESNLENGRTPKKGLSTALKPPPPKPTGNFEKAFSDSPVKVSASFKHSTEHHNPMEMFATTTIFEGPGKLTIYDKTQGTINSQMYVANIFGLHFKDVRVVAPYVGGAFGSGLRPQYQLFLCVLASLQLKRNVRVTLDRKQMFTFGHRPQTVQTTKFSAETDGKLTALHHSAFGETSKFEDYTENVVSWSHQLYPAKNTELKYEIVPLDLSTPLDMRAPGGCTGMHAIEVAMDELSYKLKMDPLELRLRNYSSQNPAEKKPFTSKELEQCYLTGARKFGWSKRNPEPGKMTRGNKMIGYGMSTGIWDAMQLPARAEARLSAQGKLLVQSAVTDIGTGTLTIMTQIAADELGLPMKDVTFSYGDSKKPFAPIQGGSFTTATVGSAVVAACRELRKKLIKLARKIPGSPFEHARDEDILFTDGKICLQNDHSQALLFSDIVIANNGREIKTTNTGLPNVIKLRKYSKAVHSAAFIEVEVDKELGTIAVTRALTVVAAGKIINPKTARSQILGGMVWGISKSLFEETILDSRLGKYMNTNLSEYHIPVHSDIHELDVIFADEKDELINELGVKGVGEIGLVAMPAAISNAVYHATGKRIYDLPIHFDQLLGG